MRCMERSEVWVSNHTIYHWQIAMRNLTYYHWLPVGKPIYPEQYCCTNPTCSCSAASIPLKKEQQCWAIIFTSSDGAQPAWSIHLYCTGEVTVIFVACAEELPAECKTNYHHDYSVKDGQCTYYKGVPDLLQVGEHQFVGWSHVDGLVSNH